MRNIFFDLDGTLIDSKPRLYKLFCDLLPEANLSFTEYWKLKRQQVGHEKIIADFNKPELQFEDFQVNWMKKIEEKEYLELDIPFPGIREMFERLKKRGDAIMIVTSRQFPELARWQINKWNWQTYLDDIIVTQQSDKSDLIKQRFSKLSTGDIIVGDTGKDIEAGHQLGIVSIAVLSGFRDKASLLKYKPDHIFNTVIEIDFDKL